MGETVIRATNDGHGTDRIRSTNHGDRTYTGIRSTHHGTAYELDLQTMGMGL